MSVRPHPITTYGKTTNIYMLVIFCRLVGGAAAPEATLGVIPNSPFISAAEPSGEKIGQGHEGMDPSIPGYVDLKLEPFSLFGWGKTIVNF